MSALAPEPASARVASEFFSATHWSVVLAAGQEESPGNLAAREELCRTYWPPIYGYVRGCGFDISDAQDLTQGFFLRLLASQALVGLSPEKGKFRAFLLAALKHFLADERDRANAVKRGAGQVVSLDFQSVEERWLFAPTEGQDADLLFDRRWALMLLDSTLARLECEFATANKLSQFRRLKEFLTREPRPGEYSALAQAIGLTSGAVAVAVHRLRQRYRELLRWEVARTVSAPGAIDEELHYLFVLLNR